jgi:hypothetical protein
MDLVTFATRVCKLLGVETMIGVLTSTLYMLEVEVLMNRSHKRSRRIESTVPCW